MSLRLLVVVNALIGLIFGVALLLTPDFLLSTYGLHTDAVTLLVARLLGAEFLGFNSASLLALGHLANAPIRRAFVISRIFSEGSGFVVVLLGKLADMGNGLVWSIVGLYGFFALAYLAALFLAPRSAKA